MSAGPFMPRLLGFDPDMLTGLDRKYVRALSLFSLLAVYPCALIGGAAGYGLWLIDHSIALSAAGAVGFGLLMLNLLRVSIAGSGMTLHFEPRKAARWRPRLTPVVMFGLLGVVFAQPAQLVLHSATLDPAIEHHRAAMTEAHAKAVRAADPGRAPALIAVYNRRIAASSFAVRRVQLLWLTPEKPGLFTVMFTLAVLLPLLLVRGPSLAAVRAYEGRKYRLSRINVQAEYQRTCDEVDRLLSVRPGYQGPPMQKFVDAPFCNQPVGHAR